MTYTELGIAAFFLALNETTPDGPWRAPRGHLRNYAQECPLGAVCHRFGYPTAGQPDPSVAATYLSLPEGFCYHVAYLADSWGVTRTYTLESFRSLPDTERALSQATQVFPRHKPAP